MSGKQLFFIKVAVGLVVMIPLFWFCGSTIEATTERFGGLGFIHWIIGLLALGLGLLAAWATGISILDRRALSRYRVSPAEDFEDGQVVALSGRLRVEGEPLVAPFSRIECAAYSYQVTGQRRTTSSSGSGTRSQLCLLGAHLTPSTLDAGERSFRFLAVPDVDTDFRQTALGGEWGERAMGMIKAAPREEGRIDEPDAQGRITDAARHADAPMAVDLFVSSGTGGSTSLSVSEDAVPINEPVTVLGTFARRGGGLDGQRLGGMKVFKGALDERLRGLGVEIHKGFKIGLPSLALGVALMTLVWWWPG